MAYVLWQRHLRHDPAWTSWPNRDRFVLSAGHGSMLLYALLHLSGYDLPMEELQAFRQWNSRTPGHPEYGRTPGVETTTGPLGQGFANAVGMAIAECHLASRFNRTGYPVVDHRTFVILSDGDLMEGVSHEAAALAGHLKLSKLICLWDDNGITIDGSTNLCFSEDPGKRFAAYGWQVLHVDDGNSIGAVDGALHQALGDGTRPSLIRVRTTIGYGSPTKAGTAAAHGAPLGEAEVASTKRKLGYPDALHFHVDASVRHALDARPHGKERSAQWQSLLTRFREAYPGLADTFDRWLEGQTASEARRSAVLPRFERGSTLATRVASGKALAALMGEEPNLIGGSADLTPSNKTRTPAQYDFSPTTPQGTYLRFGVREHAMAAICNGISLQGMLRPYCGTFLVFSDYMRPAIRLSALMELPVIYVFTHDSIGVGEDGPTHQPIEHLMALRAIPNLTVIRPADACETAEAWLVALNNQTGPTALILTRQAVPTVTSTEAAKGLAKGAYVVRMAGPDPDVLILGTGSEVPLAVRAHEMLDQDGIKARVISIPSWELFAEQSAAYKEAVLPSQCTRRVAVEAGITLGWERFVGPEGRMLGLNHFGASAPGARLMQEFGFTPDRVVNAVHAVLRT